MTESDAVDVVEIAIKHHSSDITTKAMAMVALLKLSSRFPSCSEYVMLLILFYYLLYFAQAKSYEFFPPNSPTIFLGYRFLGL